MTVTIIGVLDNGLDGLGTPAKNALSNADLVIGGSRVLALFALPLQAKATRDLTGKLAQVPSWINQALAQKLQVVVLATGDPLFYGIGSYLHDKIAVQPRILPNISALQLAFARIATSWQDAHIVSVHQQDSGDWTATSDSRHGLYRLQQALSHSHKIAVLTSPQNNPQRIARMLLAQNMGNDFAITVAQNLLASDESIATFANAEAVAKQDFNGNNIVILQRCQPSPAPTLFGIDDNNFAQRKPDKGLITKREVRAVSLARLQLSATSIVWDIGAGSGAVGIEAARLCQLGFVYAIEKNATDCAIIAANAADFAIYNYQLTNDKAPQGMDDWQRPDAVFIGGSGGELAQLIALCLDKLQSGGNLVMNFATFENLHTATQTLQNIGASFDVTLLQSARSRPILDMQRLQALNPVWVVSVQKL